MANIAQQRETHTYPLSTAPGASGHAFFKWGALVLLIVETISVGSRIVDAIIMTLGR
jgi:hypothetical protein